MIGSYISVAFFAFIVGAVIGGDYFDTFKIGAKWMQKKMIDKACDWIESYLFDIGFPDDWCRDSATMKSGKQRFLEAMEE